MTRFTKAALTVSSVCFALGIGLCIAGWLMGYKPGSYYQEQKERAEAVRDEEPLDRGMVFTDVTKLMVSVGAAECRILAFEGNSVKVETDENTAVECRQKGDTLTVSYGSGDKGFQWIRTEDPGIIRIYVPEKTVLELLEAEGGAAKISMEGLACHQLTLEVGAGDFSYEGTVEEKISVEVGMGAVSLILEGEASDFDYDMDCGLGAISVENGPSIAGAGENRVDNRADKKMELDCGLGSISVDFR